jgi:drug/metabolite transporter (DMT)-like permease
VSKPCKKELDCFAALAMTGKENSLNWLRSLKSSGVAYMLLGVFVFVLNDALGKWLADVCTVAQILALRSLAALVILAPLAIRAGWRSFRTLPDLGGHGLRIVLTLGELACFYAAVRGLPLGDVMTLYQATPLFVTALSLPLLGERVPLSHWLAVLVGFVGVVLVLQPTAATIAPEALIAVLGSLLYALLMMTTRRLRAAGPLPLLVLPVVGTTVAGGAALPFAWVPLDPIHWFGLAVIGVGAVLAHYLINQSLSFSPAATVVPLQYTSILWATLAGWLFWGDVPAPSVLAGGALIVACGLFVMTRERPPAEAT